jgi:hypothetical protein
MRMIFGVLGLLLVVAIIGMLAKKQLSSVNDIRLPAAPGSASKFSSSSKLQPRRQFSRPDLCPMTNNQANCGSSPRKICASSYKKYSNHA